MAGWALLRQRDSGTPPMASAIPVLELGPERLSQAHGSALLLVLGEEALQNVSCPASWLAVHPCRALVSQGHAAQPAGPLGPQTLPCTRTARLPAWLYRGVAVALRKWEWGGAHTLHPKGPCPTPPLPLPHATHPSTLGQQLYFPTIPPTNLPLPLPQPQLPLPSPARGQAVPPAYSLETPGVGW